tara:strand:+ start:956 stop:1318 length:363 start_codon:yes stop_codon:yes gene_type:complete
MCTYLGPHLTRADGKPSSSSSSSKSKKEKGEKKKKEPKEKSPGPWLSADLQAVVGVERADRFQVVKLLWVYIKEHNLQNPNNKKEIICDEKLQKVIGRKTVTMFSMNKYIGAHLYSDHVE